MKKIWLLLVLQLLVFSGCTVAEKEPNAAEKILSDPRVRVMNSALLSLMENDPVKKAGLILEMFEADISSADIASTNELQRALNRCPDKAFIHSAADRIVTLLEKNPDSRILAAAWIAVAQTHGFAPEKICKVLLLVLRQKQDDSEVFRVISGAYTTAALLLPQVPETLPFEVRDFFSGHFQLHYYANLVFRSYFTGKYPFAEKSLQTALAKMEPLCSGDERSFSDFIAALLQLKLSKEADAAIKRHPEVASLGVLLETASCCGKVDEVERLLRSYPAIPGELRVQLRWKAGMQAKKYDYLENMIQSISDPGKKLLYDYQLAVVRRDTARQRQMLRSFMDNGSFDRAVIAVGFLNLAQQSGSLEDYRLGKKLYSDQLTQKPGAANTAGYISCVLDQDLEEAEKLLAFALSAEPENFAFLDSFAWIRFRRGDVAGAKKALDRAMQNIMINGSSAVLLDHAGDVAMAENDRKKALFYYRNALIVYEKYEDFLSEFDRSAVEQKIRALEQEKKQ